ncbi:hypothetical protein CLAFUW4_02718 [Fulvia fulva]|uniref:F-box domain-containing protein n=1 Tax=Passalora fulva TaxID=5499 RepID=A0A9Q8P5D3_PASFU|nr:uncharacterized protein CLAFUR5_02706 [Fulvia fulva]KAK4631600.1 hypothetical protein CLAFUR4_02713 [Fulvia fulva]KAK4633735.1 hypothetical protein CLAFUR0_02715 [Fulvia fulva]UJO13814.1 hypothetical protein CLAFUR5_02706 [Fulvia fulva]WPV11233.1 hypothetical protein CLAFUW4_02718 [Fulvia fulva]WPV26651.1 hypothetical protein CLAFUW7_02717 [Fulvia fulva]
MPAELQLKILSDAPAREIQRCRAISRHYRDLIDLEANRSLCSVPGLARSTARLQAFIERYCEYPMTKIDEYGHDHALLDAFLDYLMLHGVCDPTRDEMKALCQVSPFAQYFIARQNGSPSYSVMRTNDYLRLACNQLFLHCFIYSS